MSASIPELLRLTHDLRSACGLLFTIVTDAGEGFYVPPEAWADAKRAEDRIRILIRQIEALARNGPQNFLENNLGESRTPNSD